jgi:hypothetical protein
MIQISQNRNQFIISLRLYVVLLQHERSVIKEKQEKKQRSEQHLERDQNPYLERVNTGMAAKIRAKRNAALRCQHRFCVLPQFQSQKEPTYSYRLEYTFLDHFAFYGG